MQKYTGFRIVTISMGEVILVMHERSVAHYHRLEHWLMYV